jgi:predicted ester cyclase
MSEENKAVMRRIYEEFWNEGNFEALDEIVSPDYVLHVPTPPGVPSGREGLQWVIQMYRAAFPDIHVQVEDQLAEGDKVLTRITIRGTHQGQLMHIPPTNKEVTFTAMVVTRFKDGQNVEGWAELDRFGLMQQLGVMPAPGEGGQ